jgi:hypothetical protein
VRPPFGGGGHYALVFAVLGRRISLEGPATKGAAANADVARGRWRLAAVSDVGALVAQGGRWRAKKTAGGNRW